jgi:hypothetical protein
VNLRVSRAFVVAGRVRIEGMAEAFNVTNHVNPLTRTTSFGAGPYPTNPANNFNQITAVGDPRTFQLGLRLTY